MIEEGMHFCKCLIYSNGFGENEQMKKVSMGICLLHAYIHDVHDLVYSLKMIEEGMHFCKCLIYSNGFGENEQMKKFLGIMGMSTSSAK